eukprot:gene29124-38186_t
MELALKAFVHDISGSFVETGVWKEDAVWLPEPLQSPQYTNSTECHHSWLFDSFEGERTSYNKLDIGLPKPRKEDELAQATTTVRNHQHSVMAPPGSCKSDLHRHSYPSPLGSATKSIIATATRRSPPQSTPASPQLFVAI